MVRKAGPQATSSTRSWGAGARQSHEPLQGRFVRGLAHASIGLSLARELLPDAIGLPPLVVTSSLYDVAFHDIPSRGNGEQQRRGHVRRARRRDPVHPLFAGT